MSCVIVVVVVVVVVVVIIIMMMMMMMMMMIVKTAPMKNTQTRTHAHTHPAPPPPPQHTHTHTTHTNTSQQPETQITKKRLLNNQWQTTWNKDLDSQYYQTKRVCGSHRVFGRFESKINNSGCMMTQKDFLYLGLVVQQVYNVYHQDVYNIYVLYIPVL